MRREVLSAFIPPPLRDGLRVGGVGRKGVRMMASPVDGAAGTFLERIVAARRAAVDAACREDPLERIAARAMAAPRVPRSLASALRIAAGVHGGLGVIAEIKRASPSKGMLRPDLDPTALAMAYAQGGAAALSVLTEPAFFQARAGDLSLARSASSLPVLRKDFVVHPWQVFETAVMGADALLLIVAVLGRETAAYVGQALALGIEPLVEVHDAEELEIALATRARCIGINNRNLRTFEVDLATSQRLAPVAQRAGRLVIAESGISGPLALVGLREAGVRAVLVGESLLRAASPSEAVRRLVGGGRTARVSTQAARGCHGVH